MHFIDNWISLKEVHDEIFYCLLETESEHSASTSIWPCDADMKVWEFCASSIDIRAAMPDGKTKKIPKEYVEKPKDIFLRSSNTHVKLADGWIGSGSFVDGEEMFPPEIALEREYGPLLRCNIIFRKNEFKIFLDKLKGNEEENSLSKKSYKAIANKIIESVDNGTYKNKTQAKKTIGVDVTCGIFKLAWALVVEKYPKLSHPGRPIKKPDENQNF